MGVRLSKRDALSRFERREADPADPDDAPLSAPAAPPAFANEDGSPAKPADPVAAALSRAAAKILDGSLPFETALQAALKQLEALPALAGRIDASRLERALYDAMVTAATEGAKR